MPDDGHALVRSDRGVILIIVLWVVMLLAVMLQSFIVETRTDAQLTRNLIDNGQARALADGGVHHAIDRLLRARETQDVLFDGNPTALAVKGGVVEISVQDEAGKIDLNTAPDALLVRLFQSAEVEADEAQSLVDRIADWRDRNNLRRLTGAEDRDYRAANLPYGAKDQPFATVEELQLVLGVTPALYRAVAPALTVYSRKRGVDLRAAPEPVLRAISLADDDQLSELLSARQERDLQSLNAALRNVDVPPRFVANSSRRVFTVRASVRIESGATAMREAVVRLSQDEAKRFTILAWRPGPR